MSWVFPALGFSFCFAAYLLLNQHYKIPAAAMVLWRGMGCVVLLSPIVVFLDWPKDPVFYGIIAVMGIFAGVYERQTYDIAARGNAGGLSRLLLPLSLWVSFIIWILLSADVRMQYLERPLESIGVLIALALCAGGMIWMHRSRLDAALLYVVMPAAVLRGVTDVLNKTAMMHSADMFPQNLPVYVWWLSVWVVITVLVQNRITAGKFIPENPFRMDYAKPGIILSVTLIALMLCKGAAMQFTPNPAYVTAVGLMSAIWVAAYHRARREPDPSHLWAGALVVLGTVLLVFMRG